MRCKALFKPLVVFTVMALAASSLGLAQTRRHDLSVSYGLVTIDQVADVLEDLLLIVITIGSFYKSEMDFTGAPFLTYHFAPKSRFGFGLAVGGYQTTGTLLNNITETPVGPFKETNYIGALEIDYRWVMKRGFQLYSGAGFGARIRKGTYTNVSETATDTTTLPTFHINALGLRFGNNIGFFAELGAGYKGVINLGLSAQF